VNFKINLAILSFLFASVAWAKDWHNFDNASTDLLSLNYYPHAGIIEIDPHVTASLIDRIANSKGTSTKVGANQIYAGVIYGIIPGLRIGLNETMLWDQVSDALATSGTETITTTSGPSDPTISFAWRYIESREARLSGDLTINVTPSFGPKVLGDGSVDKTGNNLSGGWVIEFSSSLHWRWSFNQMEINSAFTRNFESTTEGSASSSSYTTSPYWSYSLGFTDRIHLDKSHFLQGSLTYDPAVSHLNSYFNDQNTRSKTTDSLVPGFEFGYSPEPDYLIEASLSFHQYTASSITQPTGVVTDTSSTTLTGTIALLHQF
jgi:hypothetical protein